MSHLIITAIFVLAAVKAEETDRKNVNSQVRSERLVDRKMVAILRDGNE